MKVQLRVIGFLIGILGGSFFKGAVVLAADAHPTNRIPLLRAADNEYAIGSPQADVALVEYGSLTCHVCSEFYRNVLPQLLKDFKGRIKVIVRPLPFNALDVNAALIILHSKDPHKLALAFYQEQEKLSTNDQLGALKKIALEQGMSIKEIDDSLNDEALKNSLFARWKILNATSAPLFVIGKTIFPGLPNYESYFKPALAKIIAYKDAGHSINDFNVLQVMNHETQKAS